MLIKSQAVLISGSILRLLFFEQVKLKKGTSCMDTMGQAVGGGPIGLSYCHHFGGSQVGPGGSVRMTSHRKLVKSIDLNQMMKSLVG